MSPIVQPDPTSSPAHPAVRIHVKAVPGSSKDVLAGPLGDRLKVRVSAPPEGGKANLAVCRLLAAALGLPFKSVHLTAGLTRPEKTVTAVGIDVPTAAARLGLDPTAT